MIPRYSRKEMAAIWSDQSRFEAWLEVELAVLRELEAEGLAEAGSADAVSARVKLDPERIAAIEAVTHHDVIAFLTHVEEQAGEAARFLHFGLTSSDVLDTALALQLRRASRLLSEGLDAVLVELRVLAERYKSLPMMGRTHGIHAEPITLGLKFARFHSDLRRIRHDVRAAGRALRVGKLSGAVGAFSILEPRLEQRALASLGLLPDVSATQVIARDRHATLLNSLAVLASFLERLATELRHSQRTEVGELAEPFGKGQKGSSAMPHKRNPILTENLTGLARLVRRNSIAAMEDVALWHERDISHSSVERVILPESFILADFMLHRMAGLLRNLVVDEAAIARNLASSRGLYASQKILSMLIQGGLARQEAYDLVRTVTMATWQEGGEFIDRCLAEPELVRRLGEPAIRGSLGVEGFLENLDELFARIFTEEDQQEG
jgi:adenylosuccinate lyase